jgi:hypothetical protein
MGVCVHQLGQAVDALLLLLLLLLLHQQQEGPEAASGQGEA